MVLTVDRYNQLAESYIKLSENFQQLDVEHMRLKQQLVPLLKALQSYQRISGQWKQKKAELEARIQSLEADNATLRAALELSQNQEVELNKSLKILMGQQDSLTASLQTLTAQKEDLEIVALSLNAEKNELLGKLQVLETQWAAIKPLEALLQEENQVILKEAEEQMLLVEETLKEIEADSDPDLPETDKQLLSEYYEHPEKFALLAVELSEMILEVTPLPEVLIPVTLDLPQSA